VTLSRDILLHQHGARNPARLNPTHGLWSRELRAFRDRVELPAGATARQIREGLGEI
jgi:hypothetical protein